MSSAETAASEAPASTPPAGPAVRWPVPQQALQAGAAHRAHPFPSVLEAASSTVRMVAIALFILTFLVQPFRIPSESMERTLLVGDFLLVDKMLYAPRGPLAALLPYHEPARGDVVVFHFPLDPADYVVKRIIGVPGDRIHLLNGVVYRNGVPLAEPYTVYERSPRDAFRDQFPAGVYTDPGVDTHWWLELKRDLEGKDLLVPPGRYFVLGDNRNHSRDSRYWGFVPRGEIVGRPFLIYFSLREPSATDVPDSLPGGRLGGDDDPVGGVVDFARWDRMFRIVR